MKNKQGISLIMLVITIIVIVILAGAVIVNLTNESTNTIETANEAKYKAKIGMYKSELVNGIAKKMLSTDNAQDITEYSATGEDVKYYIPSLKTEDVNKFAIESGKLVLVDNAYADGAEETTWAAELGLTEESTGGSGTVVPPVPGGSESAFTNNGGSGDKVLAPKLATGMTPVVFESGNDLIGEEVAKTASNWYSYTNQGAYGTDSKTSKWANAVVKNDDGNVTGYFVWIPRYAYKIDENCVGTSTAGEIDVIFVDLENKDKDGNDIPAGYIVHPAFTDESGTNYANGGWDSELSGIWVAKYEAGTNTTLTYNKTITANSKNYPVFLPNTVALRDITIGDMYEVSKAIDGYSLSYSADGNAHRIYNLESGDSHQMKNSEWGAVAYLTQSKYGRNGIEVTINSNSSYISASDGDNTSTTGNKYGIYDLSGSAFEYTAGYLAGGDSNLETNGNQIVTDGTKTESNKYKSVYAGNSSDGDINYNNSTNSNRKGEAIWETSSEGTGSSSSWYQDYSYFCYSSLPFLVRGGYYYIGDHAGVFYVDNAYGGASSYGSFRVCVCT